VRPPIGSVLSQSEAPSTMGSPTSTIRRMPAAPFCAC
jgi:hypothetical protein